MAAKSKKKNIAYPDGVTDIAVYPYEAKDNPTVAFVNVTILDKLILKSIRVVDGRKGLFIAFPQTKRKGKKGGEDEYFDIFFPITKEFREELTEAILEAYEKTAE